MKSVEPLGPDERNWFAVTRLAAFVIPGIFYFGIWAFVVPPLNTWIWPAAPMALTGAIGFFFPKKILCFFVELIKGGAGVEDP